MTSQINAHLPLVLIDERLRTAHHHRSGRRHSYSVPIVREIPRPVSPDPLGNTG
jgi:hypothetical protein